VDQPARLKHYELISRLGEGGMGVVYRARDTRLGREVALKVLPEELGRDEDRSRRFEREARIASSISHPGIATLYDIDRDGDTAFLTMELVHGSTLRQLLETGDGLPLRQVLDCAIQVAEAMAAAHRTGVVHRDLKPENVMAADSGYYKVLDFGIARMEHSEDADTAGSTRTPTRTWMTRAGAVIGTVAYMSPEQALGENVDARSDIFSFGSLLYELIAGRPAFSGANEIATAQAITSGEPSPLAESRPDLPGGLAAVVAKCLAKRPDARYASAEELAEDLRALHESMLTGARTAPRLHARAPGRARWRWLLAGAAVLALVAVVTAVLLLGGDRTAPVGVLPAEEGVPPAPPAAPLGLGDARPAAAGPPRVVVAFFENNSGDPESDWLSRGLPEMLTTDLSRSDELEVIATQRLYDLLEMSGQQEAQLDRSTTAELARWAGADVVISGSVFRMGEQYRLDAQAHDTASGTVLVAHKVEGTELFRMVDELTRGIREGLQVGRAKAEPAPLRAATRSEEAYRRFLDGKRLYDGLRLDAAADELREALRIDPEFHEARLRLAMVLHRQGDREGAGELLSTLAARPDSLSGFERLLAAGLHAYWVEEDAEAGNAQMEELVRRFPQEQEAFVWWGRGLAELGEDPLQATLKLRRAIEIDPNDPGAIAALVGQLAALGAVRDARTMLAEAIERNPDAEPTLGKLADRLRDE
jgi:TolB-like protein/predicted Ser/Thr protein kinase